MSVRKTWPEYMSSLNRRPYRYPASANGEGIEQRPSPATERTGTSGALIPMGGQPEPSLKSIGFPRWRYIHGMSQRNLVGSVVVRPSGSTLNHTMLLRTGAGPRAPIGGDPDDETPESPQEEGSGDRCCRRVNAPLSDPHTSYLLGCRIVVRPKTKPIALKVLR